MTYTIKPPEDFTRYRLRRCFSQHFCQICNERITYRQLYRDGGFGHRAHEECVKREKGK